VVDRADDVDLARRGDETAIPPTRQSYPIGVESVRKLPNLTQGLFDCGYPEDDVRALIGGGWLRAMRKFCGWAAARIRVNRAWSRAQPAGREC
jgi:membrane dipeptidase (peptidase family M19)